MLRQLKCRVEEVGVEFVFMFIMDSLLLHVQPTPLLNPLNARFLVLHTLLQNIVDKTC